jgi:hypothetical protein
MDIDLASVLGIVQQTKISSALNIRAFELKFYTLVALPLG